MTLLMTMGALYQGPSYAADSASALEAAFDSPVASAPSASPASPVSSTAPAAAAAQSAEAANSAPGADSGAVPDNNQPAGIASTAAPEPANAPLETTAQRAPTPPPAPLPPEINAAKGALPPTQDDLVAQLKSFDRVLARHPDDLPAREGRLLTLSRLGAVDIAIAEAERYPSVRPEVVARLYEQKATLALRWSENTYYTRAGEDYPAYDRAIALAQANLERFPDSLQSRYDLIRALNNRKHRAEATALYAALPPDADIPPDVHESAGAAYLAQRKPEQAEQAFRRALAAKPEDFNASMGLFYALVDQNRFADARALIHHLAAQPLQPPEKFSAVTAMALEEAFEGNLATAQRQLETLQQEAPSSDQLHMALGRVYLWRGWPRRAREQFDLVIQRDPSSLSAGTALVEADTALGSYGAAEERLGRLRATTPDDSDVRNLTRAEQLRQANELTVSLIGTRSSENLASGRGVIVESRLLGKPISPQLRPFIHEYFERGITNDIRSDYRRLGAGLQYTIPNIGTVEAEVQQEFFKHPKTSASLTGNFPIDDQWTVRGRLDSNSTEVPLVARYYGISGWLAGVGVRYRDSERWWVSADLSQLNMSDENTRRAVLVRGAATVIQGPVYKGSVELEFYRATNSIDTAPYFNPKDSQTVMLSYISDWNNFQRYDRTFGQRLVLSIGRQAERGFSSATIGGVSYEQRVSLSDALSLSYGAGYVRRIYSGNVSSGPEIHLNLNWKFL